MSDQASAADAFAMAAGSESAAVSTAQSDPLPIAKQDSPQSQTQEQAAPKAPPAQAKPSQWEIERQKLIDQHAAEKAELARRTDQANGKYGEAKRKLDQYEAEKKKAESDAAQKALESRSGRWEAFKNDFPDLAEPIAARTEALEEEIRQLREMYGADKKVPNDQQKQDDALNQETLIEQRIAAKVFAKLHPDASKHAWPENVGGQQVTKYSPEFQAWLNTLSDNERKDTVESWDAEFVTGQFGKFKSWIGDRNKQVADRQNKSKQRIDSAVMPRSSPSPMSGQALTAEQAFEMAANS